MTWKRSLRWTAVALAMVSLVLWLALGANRGWTKTNVTRMARDPVTELDYPVTEKKFVPGIDFLGTCWIFAIVLTSVSLLGRKSKNTN